MANGGNSGGGVIRERRMGLQVQKWRVQNVIAINI